ncbi:MAG: hypothetical protein IPN03_24270 [Holophagales bacterium]|nr:hypothetical protein [Holophagales bacterium]
MKKFTVLVALALLAATGTSYAVTCSTDNVPGATLLVPYFQVSGSAAAGAIAPGGVDTLVAITNVSEWGAIAHVTIWNKQSAAVLDFNVPMTGFDVAFFSMRDVLNGNLNVNPNTQVLQAKTGDDPCQDDDFIGNDQDLFTRFENPDSGDFNDSIGFYATPAFSGNFRNRVLDSLDESPAYSSLGTRPANDVDNPACGIGASDGVFTSSFSGYVTIDVVNYCTNFFPNQSTFYTNDAIATMGWDDNWGPNVLMGDVFFIDPAAAGGNISGDAAISLEFDVRLENTDVWADSDNKTFYGRYGQQFDDAAGPAPSDYWFLGDGREPLGTAYAFRYLNDAAAGLTTWAVIWRSDRWDADDDSDDETVIIANNLCDKSSNATGNKMTANGRQISVSTWDNDENQNQQTGGGPSGDEPIDVYTNVWWESNRILVTGNGDLNPAGFKGGWTRLTFNRNYSPLYHQAHVSVQHTAPGAFVSVGHDATLIDHQFLCPAGFPFAEPGNIAYGTAVE